MKRLTLLIILLVFSATPFCVWGQGNSDKSGTTAAQFLKIGVGARAMAMAGAYVAQADDGYSLYWNPSGLTKLQNYELVGSYTRWFAGIDHQFLGIVLPVTQNTVLGFQGIFLNTDPIQITTVSQPHGTGEFFDVSDLAVGISFAARLTHFFSVGLTGKFIQQSIHNESASTFALDIGTMLDIPFKGLKLGMNFSNFGGKMKLDGRDLTREFDLNPDNTLNTGVETRLKTQSWDLPVNFNVGLAMDIVGQSANGFVQNENSRVSFTIDGNHPADTAEYINFGIEYSYSEIISLRGGYRLNRDLEKFFYGVGLNIPLSKSNFKFDYALASFSELDYVHIFSFGLTL